MIKWAATTSKSKWALDSEMIGFCQEHGIPIIERQNKGVQKLLTEYGLDYLLVMENGELIAHSQDNRLAYHPGMAAPRFKLWEQGKPETIITALALQPGERVLDCTMGLASDALLASALVGEAGVVTCLESSQLIYIITKYGLKHCTKGGLKLQAAMRRIEPIWGDYHAILPTLADASYDLVYFDPMFIKPREKSSGIAGLRDVADYYQLTETDLAQARRVAAKRVVVKLAKEQMDQPLFDEVVHGRYSPIAFGILWPAKGGF